MWRHCETTGLRGRTVTLKIKFSDFLIVTRSRSVPASIDSREALEVISLALLRAAMPLRRSVRLLGISLSSLLTPKDGRPQKMFDV